VKTQRALVEALLLFLAFFLPGFIAQASVRPDGALSTFALVQSIAVGVPQFLLMAFVAGATGPSSSPTWGFSRLRGADALRILVLVVICFAAVAPFFLAVSALPSSWSLSLSRGYRWGLQSAGQLPLALAFSLTSGYREEFFFRAYLLKRLDDAAVPPGAAVALSTGLFCIGHIYEGPLGVAIAAALGIVFAVAYLRRGNLHVIAIAHGLYNTAVLCLSLLAPRALPGAAVFRIFWS
jgi:membrane protease YdiL (CAAX protease family)